MSENVYYAIGDVHGELQKLDRLYEYIREDAQRLGSPPFVIHVGDLIDRGPDSRGVVERVMRLHREAPDRTVTLRGNHEELMLHACDREDAIGLYHWAVNGGDETIASYEAVNGKGGHWRQAIDRDHVAWIRSLPTLWRDETRNLAFVHAGIDPKTFPACDDAVRLWTRSNKFFDPGRWPKRPEVESLLVVHGHTPTHDFEPHLNPRRINIDTGACFGGPLTSVVLAPGEPPRFLRA